MHSIRVYYILVNSKYYAIDILKNYSCYSYILIVIFSCFSSFTKCLHCHNWSYTIAEIVKSSTAAVYKAGSLSINDILEKEPAFSKLANIKSEQFCNIDSVDMTRIKLSEYVQKLIDDPILML